MSGILDYIWDFPKEVKYLPLYLKIVSQILSILGIISIFSKGLIKVMKKDKSRSKDIKKLLAPIARHKKADQASKNCQKNDFGNIIKHWN